MTNRQVYGTVDELVSDLETPGGDITALLKHLRAASQMIEMDIGRFIPVIETVTLDGKGSTKLFIAPLLSVTSIVNDDDTLATADYILMPVNRHWPDGPYSWIIADPDSSALVTWYDDAKGVVIAGLWGKYNKSEATGATLGAAISSTSTTSLQASDGSKVSPGAVLLVDSEQMFVSAYGSPSAAVTTLNGALDASQEDITLTNGALVYTGELIRVELEHMKVLDINGNIVYVRRGYNKTKAVTHATGKSVDVYRTFTVERGVNNTTAATHLINTAVSHYLPPDDVNYLCREIAALLLRKAQSGFAGKTGNDATGTAYYNDEIPLHFFEQVKQRYCIYP